MGSGMIKPIRMGNEISGEAVRWLRSQSGVKADYKQATVMLGVMAELSTLALEIHGSQS